MKNRAIILITITFSVFFISFLVKTTFEFSNANSNILKSSNVIDATNLISTQVLVTKNNFGDDRDWVNYDFDDSQWKTIRIPFFPIVKLDDFKEGNYAYYRIKLPKSAFSRINHLNKETSLFLQSIYFTQFNIFINGNLYRSYKPNKPGENIVIVPVDESRNNLIAIQGIIHSGDSGIDSRNRIMLGKGLELNQVHTAGYKGQTAFQLVFILCKGSILFIFSIVFLLLNVDKSFEKFFVFGICTVVEELIAGDYLYGPLNFNEMVYLYNAVNIGAAIAVFLFFRDLINISFKSRSIWIISTVLALVSFTLAIDALHLNKVVDISLFMKFWNLIFVAIQVYFLPRIFKFDKVLFSALCLTISLSLWSALFSSNIGLNFKAYGNLLLFFIVAYQTFALFRREQEELRNKEMLLLEQEKDVVIGKTASLFAHDVRKPLDQIKLVIEKISSGNVDKEFLESAKNEIDLSIANVNQQVSDIMNYSKISSVSLTEISFYKVLSHAVKQSMSLHQEMNIDLLYDFKNNHMIFGEESRLSGILVNLLANAIEAIRDQGGKFDGKIILSTAQINDRFIFKIFNDGPEIPESILKSIFKPLFTQGKSNGTGLGLASVVKSLGLLQGTIIAANVPRAGVEFTVTFQNSSLFDQSSCYIFMSSSKDYNYEKKKTITTSKMTRVLVLESSAANQSIINTTLERFHQNLKISSVSKMSEAEDLIIKNKFDLYIMNSSDGGDNIYNQHLKYLSYEVILYSGSLPESLWALCRDGLRKKTRVLYVDDTKIFRVAWQMFHGDDNITCLSSPEEAIHHLVSKDKSYDICVIDYHFSNSSMDGYTLSKKIKEILPNSVILLSSSVTQEQTEFRSINKNDYDVRKYIE